MELNQEYPSPDEDALIKILLKEFRLIFNEENPPCRHVAVRGTHKKTVACLKGELTVEKNLPEDLSIGLFKEEKTYPTWIRLSRTFFETDMKRDSSSFSFKVLDVPGEKILDQNATTQDFTMRNDPTFYVKNIPDFIDFARNRKTPLRFFFPSFNPLKWRLRELKNLSRPMRRRCRNPLEEQYWSEVPYLYGSRAIKYSVKPHPENRWQHSYPITENYLRKVVTDYIEDHSAAFDFLVQFQSDPINEPIEDPTIEWKTPFIKVATIRIPPQDITDPEHMERGENLSFNPWHSLPEHRPIGGLNRARKLIYSEISKARHERNHVDEDLG